jgi:hypothetical protein
LSAELKRALTRVQTDYSFFIECQTNPDAALADFDLSGAERSILTDPDKLTDMIMRGNGEVTPQAAISVTISGTHDWVNVAPQPDEKGLNTAEHHALIAAQIEAVKRAGTDDERKAAVARLVELVG